MRKASQQAFNLTQVISLSLLTALLSLSQPIHTVFAQQMAGRAAHETENFDRTRSYQARALEIKDAQALARKPHRLIRKPQNDPVASLEPSSIGSTPIGSSATPPPSLQSDNSTSSSNESSSLSRSVGAAAPLATISIAPSTAAANNSFGTASIGSIPLAAVGTGTSSTSGDGAGGRSMNRLAAEMPGLAQLITPPSAPISVNPAIGASPISLSFTAQQGGVNPATQTLSISNTGGGTLIWNASNNTSWLSLSSASGTGAGAVAVGVTTGTLTAGSYSGTVILSATGASSVTVPVSFTVTAAPVPPAIGASPTSLSFTATAGGTNPAAQTLSISNTGGGTLNWSANESAAWLTVSPTSGTGNGTVTLSAVTGTLAAGSYSGMVTLSGTTGVTPIAVPITFTVAAAPAIGASPTSLSFAATAGGANPASQTVTVSNTGGTLNWAASDTAAWLSLTPATGSGNGTLAASVNTAGLTTGTYTSTITVAASGATSGTVNVTLTVNAPASSSATLTWNANTETDLAGYKVYRATASGAYGAPITILTGNVTNYVATGLQVGTTYFFAVTAFDNAGNESGVSNEVSKSIF